MQTFVRACAWRWAASPSFLQPPRNRMAECYVQCGPCLVCRHAASVCVSHAPNLGAVPSQRAAMSASNQPTNSGHVCV
eukprot:1266873-Prymnesium_polylepis.1